MDPTILSELPFFNANIWVDEIDRKKEEAIFDKIIRQLPPNNNRFYLLNNDKNRYT